MSHPAGAPEERSSLGGQLAAIGNIFLDPASAAREIPKKHSWVVPLLITLVVASAVAVMTSPIAARIFRQFPPENMSPEQVAAAASMMEKFKYVSLATTPLFILIVLVMQSGLLMAASSILDIRTKFVHLVSLLCYAGIIPTLQAVAGFIVTKAKEADIQSMKELRPHFGLDLVIHPESRLLDAVLGFFSIFQVWYIIVLGLAFAALTKSSAGKAFSATAPVWILGMLVMVGLSMLQR